MTLQVLISILLQKPGFESFARKLEATADLYISAASYVEVFAVAYRRLPPASVLKLGELLSELRLQIVPFDEPQARLAREAYHRFGKGRHPAALNFGDCFSYALARHLSQPLLFKGNDFSQTDVLVADPAA